MGEDGFEVRKTLTFAQAEGAEPLPTQLKLQEISRELRAKLWNLVYSSLIESFEHPMYGGGPTISGDWGEILYFKHVSRDHLMADEFSPKASEHVAALRWIFEKGNYVQIFDFLQWLMRLNKRPLRPYQIRDVLEDCGAAYRLLPDDKTIVPISSSEESETIDRAFADLGASEFSGAREHLRKAAQQLTGGEYGNSIRESIHAVESVARTIAGKPSLSDALTEIEKGHKLHGALKKGFNNLYGFTSDEQGIRHPLLEKGAPNVDETDAMFMFGACAAFVSYLINRNRQSR